MSLYIGTIKQLKSKADCFQYNSQTVSGTEDIPERGTKSEQIA